MPSVIDYSYEELRDMIFQDDIVKVHAYIDWLKPRINSPEIKGEAKLLLSVLEAALKDYFNPLSNNGGRLENYAKEVSGWIFNGAHDSLLYTFEDVCYHLHLDPDWIRRQILRRTKRPITRTYANEKRGVDAKMNRREYKGEVF